ncbi:MAG: hypothetical protein AVDCRST_MAG56-4701 [uncultured Cytophagales bacterium]|uniref:Lipoprotein n=1 Tax=uncultured Cytophagales bacterium TaxID=158755 RepID=A0A6J4K0E2_9SPHI|nr:MAG: hypothetical protein AVDCRST_MAG56-4701 [uncultured Cytophagales bacterium]
MKKVYFIIPLVLGAFGCAEVEKQIEEDSKKEVLNTFKVELVKSLPSPSVSEDPEGVSITQDEMTYTLNKAEILLGDLDDDYEPDVVYSVTIHPGGNIEDKKHYAVLTSLGSQVELALGSNSVITGVSGKDILVTSFEWTEEDARCCPSITTAKKFSYIGNKFVQIN